MYKTFPTIDFPFIELKEVSSPEFSLNVKSTNPGKILYRVSDESVAKVNEYGFVSIVCAGATDIFAKQLETDEFEELEICRSLYVEPSNQKLIIEELTEDGPVVINDVQKKISEKFFDVRFSLDSELEISLLPLNLDYFTITELSKNVYRIFPKRVGPGSILISANGNRCYNDYQQVLLIEILEKDPLVSIDLIFSIFTNQVQHDALDEFTIITSNSGQQQVDNSLILQTTLDSKVGNGYSRNIGIINSNPSNLINFIEKNIGCCDFGISRKEVFAIDADNNNIYVGGSFTVFNNQLVDRFVKLNPDLSINSSSSSSSFSSSSSSSSNPSVSNFVKITSVNQTVAGPNGPIVSSVTSNSTIQMRDFNTLTSGFWISDNGISETYTHSMSVRVAGARLRITATEHQEPITFVLDGTQLNLNSAISNGSVIFNNGGNGNYIIDQAGRFVGPSNPQAAYDIATLTFNISFTTMQIISTVAANQNGTVYEFFVSTDPVS